MSDLVDRYGAERIWAAVVGTVTAALALGSVLFTRTVYAEFVWHYFWGPVYADAKGGQCVAWANGEQRVLQDGCSSVAAELGPVAEPGYTLVSEAGYAITLIVMLIGVVFLLRRLDIQRYRALYFGLVPFMIFGGALRVVEDANQVIFAYGQTPPISYPLSTLIISPLIYFTVFAITLAALLVSMWADRAGHVEGFEYPLAGIGSALSLLTFATLAYLSTTVQIPDPDVFVLHGQVILVIATVALISTAATWGLLRRYAPELNRGTGYVGLGVIVGQAVDGAANVVGLDWMVALGLPGNLTPKHPLNAIIVDATRAIFPPSVIRVINDTWPFLLVKLVAAVLVISLFEEEIFEESPRYAILLLIAVTAVGLGPGTRDAIRATLFI